MTTRAGQLDQISAAIGGLSSDVRHLHECVHDAIKANEKTSAKVDKLAEDMTIDKADLAKLKAKGAGVLIGVAAASGLIGSKVGPILHAIGKAFAI